MGYGDVGQFLSLLWTNIGKLNQTYLFPYMSPCTISQMVQNTWTARMSSEGPVTRRPHGQVFFLGLNKGTDSTFLSCENQNGNRKSQKIVV